jgi:copper chaperone CopZ
MGKLRQGTMRNLAVLLFFACQTSFPVSGWSAFVVANAASLATLDSQHRPPKEATTALYASLDHNSNECPKEAQTPSPIHKASASKYYLLWSPGAWKKLVIGTATIFVAHVSTHLISASASELAVVVPSFFTTLATNFVLPMLASACCLLQLGLNLLSVGCAGFNTILGPLRPYFVSALLSLTIASRFSKHVHYSSLSSWATGTALRWTLALLPEALHLWNNRDDYLAPKRKLAVPNTQYKLGAVVQLDIPTMGCVACINKIDKALRQVGDQVVSAKSMLKDSGGEARVQIVANSNSEIQSLVASLMTSVSEAGFFGSTVDSIQMNPNTHVEESE